MYSQIDVNIDNFFTKDELKQINKLKKYLDNHINVYINWKFIEIELNIKEKKIIVRDNLNHTELQKDIRDSIKHGSKSEYGPVLGWNRICLE